MRRINAQASCRWCIKVSHCPRVHPPIARTVSCVPFWLWKSTRAVWASPVSYQGQCQNKYTRSCAVACAPVPSAVRRCPSRLPPPQSAHPQSTQRQPPPNHATSLDRGRARRPLRVVRKSPVWRQTARFVWTDCGGLSVLRRSLTSESVGQRAGCGRGVTPTWRRSAERGARGALGT